MYFKPLLQSEDINYKLKRIVGSQYNSSNGSSATFGTERFTGSFRLWSSFSCSVNSSSLVTIGSSPLQQVKSSLLYNSINNLIYKYTGALRPVRSQPIFTCIVFDKDALGDYISISPTGTFITSNGNTYIPKTSLSGNQLYNTNNFIPIITGPAVQVGMLFPQQGVFVNFNQGGYVLGGTTIAFWSPINYKSQAYYFRRLGCKQFNFSNNQSFSAGSLSRTYITTVGLYGQADPTRLNPTASPLLAVAKLITPCKKNDESDYLFKVNLQY